MPKYEVKEYIATFEYNEDDQYDFPRPEHCTFTGETQWDKTFCPTQIAAKALWKKHYDEEMDEDEFLDMLPEFNYGYCNIRNIHYLATDLCDGDVVEFVTISIKEI